MSFLARERSKKIGAQESARAPSTAPVPRSRQAVRANSAEEVVAAAMLPGERVLAFAPCLRRVALQLFEKATVVVTDQRVLLVAPGFPWGYELKEVHPRSVCSILTGKERKDGSRLLVVGIGEARICLYFSRSRQQESDDVLNAIRMELVPAPGEVDRGALEQEFSALAQPGEEEED